MSSSLPNPLLSAKDGENNPVQFDVAYPVRADLLETIAQIRAIHGDELYLLPLSGMSCGGGILQASHPASGCVVGLHFEAPAKPRRSIAEVFDLSRLGLDQICVDPARHEICAGASITLDQLQHALADELGSEFRVLGADLTSYAYAAVGATFMTGGMGPQRRYFSDSVIEAVIYDGNELHCVASESLQGLAGSYGWSGLVTAVRCRYIQLPRNEIAFAIPVNQTSAALAALLQHLSPFTQLDAQSEKLQTTSASRDLILGLEHVTCASMDPLFRQGADSSIIQRAGQLVEKCKQAEADGLVFVNGFSDQSVDDFLFLLVDDAAAESPTIAGISLEYTEVFNDSEQMRVLREAIPYAARTQVPEGRYIFKNHTDANVRLNPQRVAESMALLWQANCSYVDLVEEYFNASEELRGHILVYGHLNPHGVDPHNRITIASDNEQVFIQARNFVLNARSQFYRALQEICETTGSVLIGGEKGADSEREIFAAFDGPQHAPQHLRDKHARQLKAIGQASKMFNWRALQPYRC